MNRLVICLSIIALATPTPALAWTLNEDDYLPSISQPDHSGRFELKLVCDWELDEYSLELVTDEPWSEATTYPSEIPLAFEISGEVHGYYPAAVASGWNGALNQDVMVLRIYEFAPGWEIVTALTVANGTIAARYAGRTASFDAGNYDDAQWALYDACQ